MVTRSRLITAAAALLAAGTAAHGQDFSLHLLVPQVELTWMSEFDAAVLLDAGAGGVEGWSLGVAHDGSELELLDAGLGSAVATINGGEAPEFAVIETAPANGSGLTAAVVFSLMENVVLGAGDDQELLTMRYRVLANPADSVPCQPLSIGLSFTDALSNDEGSPGVRTLLTVDGKSVVPELAGGTIAVRCPGTIEMTRCEGDTASVSLEWRFGGPPEWDFLFLYRDGELVSPLDVDATSFTDEDLGAGRYEYTILTFVVDDPTRPTLLFARCVAEVVPVSATAIEPAAGNWLGGETVTITGTTFTSAESTTVTFVAEGEDPLPLEVVEVAGATTIVARTPEAPRLGAYDLRVENELGAATLPGAFTYGFTRGEVNSALPVDLSDAIFLLDFLFVGGEEAPRCMDAADVNDDGALDISDATSLLDFLFQGGDAPPAPYAEAGADPTGGDQLDCLGS